MPVIMALVGPAAVRAGLSAGCRRGGDAPMRMPDWWRSRCWLWHCRLPAEEAAAVAVVEHEDDHGKLSGRHKLFVLVRNCTDYGAVSQVGSLAMAREEKSHSPT